MRVLIIGGGLAGPCLAHGLRHAGIDVALFEGDPGPASRRQGYRIHIAPEGTQALRACLPPELYELGMATSGTPGSSVTVLSGQLDVLHRVTFDTQQGEDEGYAGISVDRLALRQILLVGLEDHVQFGAPYTHFETGHSGAVRACFADGMTADGDLLVGADGASSRVRAQLLPQATVVDTGQLAIFGKTILTDEVRRQTPPPALDGFSTIVGSDGRFLPLAGLEFRSDPAAEATTRWPSLTFADTRDYVMWVLGAPAAAYGTAASELAQMDGGSLTDLAANLIADWHADIGEVVRRADPATVASTRLRTAEPLQQWETGPVTLVGDAIHCMVPAGIGAAVALRDAALLARRLAEAAQGMRQLVDATCAYETEMLEYGFAAVQAALQVQRQMAP